MNLRPSLRIVLASVGTRGDVQPMVALALALAARGHRPLLLAPPNFASWITSLGVPFRPITFDLQAFVASHGELLGGNPWLAYRATRDFFAEETPRLAEQMLDACRDADAVVWAGGALVGPSVAEHLGRPALGVLFSTCSVPSGLHPPPTSTRHGQPAWVNWLRWWLLARVMAHLLARPLNAQRRRLGLRARSLQALLFDDSPVVVACDPVIFPPDPGWGSRVPVVGFTFLDDPAPLDPALAAWLAEGPPPVYVGFGSMSGPGTARAESVVVAALQSVGRRGLVAAGWARLGRRPLPDGWRVVDDAPHARLFPRVAAVVHHGGSGTTAAALRAGVPQVVLPLILDQYHHAHRLHLAGLAPLPIPMERVTATGLGQALAQAIASPLEPRQAAATRLMASDACGDICRRVEALVADAQRTTPAVDNLSS